MNCSSTQCRDMTSKFMTFYGFDRSKCVWLVLLGRVFWFRLSANWWLSLFSSMDWGRATWGSRNPSWLRGFVFFLDSGERAPWPSVEVSNSETSTTSSHYLRRFSALLGRMTACCVLLCLVISSSQRKRSLDNSDKFPRGRLFRVDTMSISTVLGLLTGPEWTCRISAFLLVYDLLQIWRVSMCEQRHTFRPRFKSLPSMNAARNAWSRWFRPPTWIILDICIEVP